MGASKRTLDFRRPIQTRGGSDVRFYDIFDSRYINGAYFDPDDDIWYPVQWDTCGMYGDKRSTLDLVNVPERTSDE